MKIVRIVFSLVLLLASPASILADEKLQLQKVAENVYAIVGDLGQRTKTNHGNNATFGFVVTREGVVLIDSGATYDGAQAIATIIRSVTDKAVVKVINTGGQDHRWLGNSYFRERGAEIIASVAAVQDQHARLTDQYFMLGTLLGESAIKSTTPTYADRTFADRFDFTLGDTEFELHHAGQAHTPGDSFVWLPRQKVVFTGDIVYTERILGILAHSNSKSWVKVFESMAALNPEHVVPGHGHATNLEQARKDTYGYLIDLRESVARFMEQGNDISEIGKLDQSKYGYLSNYNTLSGRNAQKVFTELEWE